MHPQAGVSFKGEFPVVMIREIGHGRKSACFGAAKSIPNRYGRVYT
jgi:hypothetical protein